MVVCFVLGQKDCDLPKSYSYNQLPNAGSSEPGGGRLNVSGGICEPHNLHQDQVKLFNKPLHAMLVLQTTAHLWHILPSTRTTSISINSHSKFI